MTSAVDGLNPLPLLLLFLLACQQTSRIEQFTGTTMGTTYSIKYIAAGKSNKQDIKKKVDALLESINKEMSTYREDSEISRFNRLRNTQSFHSVSPGFLQVLLESLSLAHTTGGAFDPTLGPLVNLWGFGPNEKRKVPTEGEIKRGS